MKTFIVLMSLVCTLFAINSVDAAFVLGFHEDYPTALAQAKKEKKVLMLVIIKDPCRHSERMVYDTLSDPKVVDALKDFISVIVDKDVILPSALKVEFVPMIYFIDPNKEEGMWERMGYVSVEKFLDDLKEVLILYKQK